MARRCFFSFHYDGDVWRSQQVKNAWITHKDREAAGFFDSSAFETAQKTDDKLKSFLNSELHGSSVTCVLIGSETYSRRWVRYEIVRSFVQNKGLFGARIHGLKDRRQFTSSSGPNPFDYLGYEWNQTTGEIKFKEFKDGVWKWYADLPTMKYSDLNMTLTLPDSQFSNLFTVHDYVSGDGYNNIGTWIESAATAAGR